MPSWVNHFVFLGLSFLNLCKERTDFSGFLPVLNCYAVLYSSNSWVFICLYFVAKLLVIILIVALSCLYPFLAFHLFGLILCVCSLTCFPVGLFELFFSGSRFSQATVFLQGLRPNFIKENFHECLNFCSLGTLRSLDCSTF